MARGWESKSVEEQVDVKAQAAQSAPAASGAREAGRDDSPAHSARLRERQALELQRERILDERTSNPIRRAALEAALKEIEAKLAAL